jgi:branched-chain amino acid transport system ATP-binding protein
MNHLHEKDIPIIKNAMKIFKDRLLQYSDKNCLNLSYANRRRLEISRAIVSKPKLLLLDEPTAGMNPNETFELQSIIAKLRNTGITIIIIEHKLYFLEDLVDRAIVIAEGRIIAEGQIEKIRKKDEVIKAYMGL